MHKGRSTRPWPLLSIKEEDLNQSEKQWKNKGANLEKSFREEVVVKESWERRAQELEKEKRQSGEMWLMKQEE